MWRSLSALVSKLGSTRFLPAMPREESGAQIVIVALLSNHRDRNTVSVVCQDFGWTVHFAYGCGEAWDLLRRHEAPIILIDRHLPDTDWRFVVQMLSASRHLTYSILVSKVVNDYLWTEVIRLGGSDLLAMPLGEPEVLRAVRMAWSYWNNLMGTPNTPVRRVRARR
jgi:DNA-binding response OmpR family regulator